MAIVKRFLQPVVRSAITVGILLAMQGQANRKSEKERKGGQHIRLFASIYILSRPSNSRLASITCPFSLHPDGDGSDDDNKDGIQLKAAKPAEKS